MVPIAETYGNSRTNWLGSHGLLNLHLLGRWPQMLAEWSFQVGSVFVRVALGFQVCRGDFPTNLPRDGWALIRRSCSLDRQHHCWDLMECG